eukprot:COSAG01_NODE_23714_length_804_cov_1.239716_1_plen_268_part_11
MAGIMERVKKPVFHLIGTEIAKIVTSKDAAQATEREVDDESDASSMVDWEPTMDFLSDVMGEAHGMIPEKEFTRMLRSLCVAWCQTVEAILGATAESLPENAIAELEKGVAELNEKFWSGGLDEREIARLCGPHSHVLELLKLHSYSSALLADITASLAQDQPFYLGDDEDAQISPAVQQLAIGVLARRPDFLKQAKRKVKSPGEEGAGPITYAIFLPPPAQCNLRNLPAEMLADTALIDGEVEREADTVGSPFQKRWLVLWRHPDVD